MLIRLLGLLLLLVWVLQSTRVAAGGVTVGLSATVIGGGAVVAGAVIYHGLRILGNWGDE